MAHEKSCSGDLTVASWTFPSSTCIYQFTIFIDGNPITNTVNLDNSMSEATIASILNSNRINNTTGTFTAQVVLTNLTITLTGVIIPVSGVGLFNASIAGPGFPCGDFLNPITTLVCNIIPDKKKRRKRGAYGAPSSFCLRPDQIPSNGVCPPMINAYGVTYYRVPDTCCYKINPTPNA